MPRCRASTASSTRCREIPHRRAKEALSLPLPLSAATAPLTANTFFYSDDEDDDCYCCNNPCLLFRLQMVDYLSALLSICFMVFLGFTDDVLDLPWRWAPILLCNQPTTFIFLLLQGRHEESRERELYSHARDVEQVERPCHAPVSICHEGFKVLCPPSTLRGFWDRVC